MKDTHLIIALYRALDRYGSTTRPDGDGNPDDRGRDGPLHHDRRRTAGWVSVAEIESSQSPNTYPRLTRRDIQARCEALTDAAGSPVRGVRRAAGGTHTWVLVGPPGTPRGGRGTDREGSEEDHDPAGAAEPEGEEREGSDAPVGQQRAASLSGPAAAFRG